MAAWFVMHSCVGYEGDSTMKTSSIPKELVDLLSNNHFIESSSE